MDLTACSVCVFAASAGGAVGGYLAGGRQGRRRGKRALRGSRTMRAWPGGRRADPVSPGRGGSHRRRGPPGIERQDRGEG